ncbi:hypothetical protein [Roseicella aquatilis]|uniref:SlyX family protein n=1 Tax=Roseicella aquatilis TaxID=2527868 RepID=A0A4R4DVI4_9PROT|nr:hypothetical protein [Roseicella aquatilis]TCZ64483.1 hypothetical protein EXY23_07515 [Roseicella aquatilis]
MSDRPDDLALLLLRRIDAHVQSLQDDVRSLKQRMTGVAEGLAGVNRRLDRLEDHAIRIERRLGLVDAPPS